MKKSETLRQMAVAELQALKCDLESEIYELKCENAVQRKLDKPHLLKEKKQQRARVLTLLKENGAKKDG